MKTPSNHPASPGPELIRKVRALFILRGTTLGRWCRDNDIKLNHARMALVGSWDGPKGRALRDRVVSAAGADVSDARSQVERVPVREAA